MIVPYSKSFESAKLFSKYANVILWFSAAILIIAYLIQSINKDWKQISDTINSINCLLIITYAILEFITNYTFYEASIQKRADFVDNSFNTLYSEDNTIEYYSNDNINTGIYKMAVNGFENSLFTYNISKRMLKPLWIKNVVIALLFILLAIVGYNNAFVMFLQLSLPLLLLKQAIKQTLFVSRINKVYENYRRLFQY